MKKKAADISKTDSLPLEEAGRTPESADAVKKPANAKAAKIHGKAGEAKKAAHAKQAKKPAKPTDLKEMIRKRQKQYRHIMTLIQVSIRVINAFSRNRTIYRK